jgi:DNA invertase Pin-like site-specific DNA recombinase
MRARPWEGPWHPTRQVLTTLKNTPPKRGEQHTEAQERALREYVQRRGWVPHTIYRDKCTGSTGSRPGLDELLKDCRRRAIDVVVVWKFDRFARSLKNLIAGLELCRALGIDFVSVTEAVDT